MDHHKGVAFPQFAHEDRFVSRQAPTARPPLEWRVFLRALAAEIDALGGEAARDELLRSVGRRMAMLMPLSAVATLEALESEMTEALNSLGWGSTTLRLEANEQDLTIVHTDLPLVGGAGSPPGQWLSAALEGLYETWIGQQPGGDPRFIARRSGLPNPSTILLKYGKS
ncbi:MAG: cellulose biosynthesis protein BcsD [Acetobacteraceae bacterium]